MTHFTNNVPTFKFLFEKFAENVENKNSNATVHKL